MKQDRRNILKAGAGAGVLALLSGAGFLVPNLAQAAEWNKAAFDGKSLQDALKAIGAASPANSNDILMKAPDIAENGAVVPVGVESRIPGTESIAVLIEKNPNPLAAVFDIPSGTEQNVSTRVKMAETSNVYAVVKAKGNYYITKKEIKVTLGGCGG